MKTLALVLLASIFPQSASAQSAESLSSAMQLAKDYHACLDFHLISFERAKEPASDTVDAIFAACEDERAAIILDYQKARKRSDPNFGISEAESLVDQLFVEPKRSELLVTIFRERSKS